MAASYPTSIKSFTYRVDNQDKVIAADVNVSYDEITAIELQLGAGGVASRTTAFGSANFDSTTIDWTNSGGLRARIENLENGVYFASTNVDGGTP
jgi:hypothetical protein